MVAQVVLLPAGGRAIAGDDRITRANLAEYVPGAGSAHACTEWFRQHRFEVGPVVGISMSIAGPPERFAASFGSAIRIDGDEVFFVVDDIVSRELPGQSLPAGLRNLVHTIVFEPPAETTDDEATVMS